MNSSFSTNKRKKDKVDCHSIKKKKKKSIIDGVYSNNTFNNNKKEKNTNKKLINIKGNFIKKEEYKKIKKNIKSFGCEIPSIPKSIFTNKNYLTIIYSNKKKEKSYNENSFHKNNLNKNKNNLNQDSFDFYNFSSKRINRKKTIQEETKQKKNIENNNSVNKEKLIQKNKKFFTQINSKKITNKIFPINNPKKISISKYKIDKDKYLNINKIENKNKQKNPKEKNNLTLNTNYNIYNSFLYSDNKPTISSIGKLNTEDISNDISTTSNNFFNDSKNNYKEDKIRESNKSYISQNESNSLKNSLTQSSKFSQSRKIKFKNFNNRHLIYKTELNLNNEKIKHIIEQGDNFEFKKKDTKPKSIERNKKYRHLYSPINVHRKIFTFKKNEIIDITNRNNYIVIVKKICDSQNRKKYFFETSCKKRNIFKENNIKEIEKIHNLNIIPKNLVMICDKMKQMNITIRPRKNLELRLFKHIKRNSIL